MSRSLIADFLREFFARKSFQVMEGRYAVNLVAEVERRSEAVFSPQGVRPFLAIGFPVLELVLVPRWAARALPIRKEIHVRMCVEAPAIGLHHQYLWSAAGSHGAVEGVAPCGVHGFEHADVEYRPTVDPHAVLRLLKTAASSR